MSKGYKSFHYLETGEVQYNFVPTKFSSTFLRPGIYSLDYVDTNIEKVATCKEMPTTETVTNSTHKNEVMLQELFYQFFSTTVKEKINSLGFNHKLGILMHGKEGSGKSTIIRTYCLDFIRQYNAVVFYVDGHYYGLRCMWEFVMNIRKTQDNPIILVFEEFEEIAIEMETPIKSMMDGNQSIDNIIIFATTNYPDKIPVALKDRPSRFKYSFSFDGIMSKESVRNIIHGMIGDIFGSEEVDAWSEDLKNSTVDVIKQFCLDKIMNLETLTLPKRKAIGFSK